METTGEKIKAVRKIRGYSAEYVAEKLGVSPATIYRYEKGDIEKVPGDTLVRIAEILNADPAYLMGWKKDDSHLPKNIMPLPNTKKLPLLGDIACGTPILAQQNIQEYIEVPADIHADFALRCHGDSMKGARILDGDVVYIHQQPTIENGEIAAVLIDDEATLKRVYISNDRVTLQPANPEFEPYVYVGEEMAAVHIIGKAVAFTSMVR